MDDFLHFYGQKSLIRSKTGTLYDISLPRNFSGIKASIVRFRTGNLWRNGANLSFLQIPSRVITTMPFVNRIDLVFHDFGNWSNSYFHVPNHTIITNVIGFRAYDSESINRTVQFEANGADSTISVKFPKSQRNYATMRCIRFMPNGSFEFINLSRPYACETRKTGHFVIVTNSFDKGNEKRLLLWKWWVIGFLVGLGCLLFIGVLLLVLFWALKKNKIVTMEKQSDMSVGLETTWIGRSRMPSASSIRTQPSLEDEYIS
ncbi:uncharacterized protein LOC124943917 [Impatiens glandulifera]|uniref:uncharacterized protein LOC124943917 n=1 Tax=Impatiens glandulifera TaxID=253017 RepID=UPI001FB16ACD|nr:uncharacterized protein LOC124943917 [Impatiens glandulifera]